MCNCRVRPCQCTPPSPKTDIRGDGMHYTGPYIPNLNIIAGEDYNTTLNKIANYVSNIQVDVQTEDSPTATIEGNGTAADKLIVQAVISAQPGNVLTNNGGLYVPTTALPEASFTNSYFDI